MTSGLRRKLGGLRVRLGVLLFGGVILVAIGFYALLLTLTRQWLLQELDVRSRTLTGLLSTRVATPLLLEDRLELEDELKRVAREPDVVGAAVYRDGGRAVAESIRDRRLWVRVPWSLRDARREETLTVHARQLGGHGVLEMVAPVTRAGVTGHSPIEEAGELAGLAAPPVPPGGPARVGWVRVLVSTARLEAAVATAGRMALTLVVTALALWLIPISVLIRVMVQPLREASELAREIAAGQLDRRLPVRSDDELGALARSMNSMAGELSEAQRQARAEADALRVASEAVVAIAREARAADDPHSMFGLVAGQARRVTGCRGVALAAAAENDPLLRITQLDPPGPWGELAPGLPLDPAIARRLAGLGDNPLRVALEEESSALARGLSRDGFRCMLVVPLSIDGGPAAALLLLADRADAFPPAEVDGVAGITTHLSSSLQASQLRERLERAFDELQTARGQLVRSERLRVAGEMASGIAHEFNNVLAAILGRAQLLRRDVRRGSLAQESLVRALEIIERAARDGGETVRRLRQFGDAGETTDSVAVDIDAAMRDAAEFTRTRWHNEAQAAGREIALTFDSVPGTWVLGRSSELREIFTNLILNANDALPQGGEIRLASRIVEDRVEVEVEDNGRGMDEATRRRVFDPFFTTKGERGTGLGLSVTYGIVQRHGGTIAIESAPGRGTRVCMSFPLGAPPPPASEPEPPRPAEPHESLTVLVVDDEQPVRELLVDILVMLGHRPLAFEGGELALAGFRPGGFDLVLTDLGMPGMNGWQLARAIRERDGEVVLAFITGWGQEVSPDAVRDAGADAVVSKPFAIEDVAGLVALAIERRHGRRAA